MRFNRILWTAVASPRLANAELDRALAEHRHANDRDAVTGIVLFDRPHLIGCAEGSSLIIGRLLRRLTTDTTFGGFQLISCAPISARKFDYWNTVAHEVAGHPTDDLLTLYRRHALGAPLRPDRLTDRQLLDLLADAHRTYDDLTRSRVADESIIGSETLLDNRTKHTGGLQPAAESVP